RLVVGQPGTLVGLDQHVVGLVGGGDDHVQAGHRDVDGATGRDGRLRESGMQARGDVVDRASGVQIGGAAYSQRDAVGQNRVEVVAGFGDGVDGDVVERDGGLTPGRGRTAAAVRLDQLGDGVPTGAVHRRGTTDRRGDDLVPDHDDAQVFTGDALLDQHVHAVRPGELDGTLQGVGIADPDGDAPALLTPRGLDHHLAYLGQQRAIGFLVTGQLPACDVQPGPLEDPACGQFVVAAAHRDRGGQLRQRLPGDDAATAVSQAYLAAVDVGGLDVNAPPAGFVGDDAGVRVELGGLRDRLGDEQRLVDRVLAFDREHRDAAEAQLLVQA